MDEELVAEADRIYCWQGPKMKATLFSAKLGRLVLTDQRLVFHSSGKSDAGRLAARAAVSPALAMRGSSTAGLDADALNNEGSLSIPLASISNCAAGKKRALVVTHRSEDGTEHSYAFGEKMGMPARDNWVEQINRLRTSPPQLREPSGSLAHEGPTIRPKILIDAGQHIHTGTALADNTIAGWTATVARADGTVGVRGTVRGMPDPIYADLAPDALLRNNPRMLYGQVVRHPAPPPSLDAAGWVVDDVDQEASTLVLTRDHVGSSVPVDDVVRLNLDELRTRIEVIPGS